MIANELRDISRQLKLLGELELSDKVLCALAAVTDAERPRVDLSYTYVMRKLRGDKKDKDVHTFQKVFKDTFEEALDNDADNPEEVALMEALQNIDFEG